MSKYFGTDGIRGKFGGPSMNEMLAQKVGEAAGKFLGSRIDGKPVVMVGHDTRPSSPLLRDSLIDGLQTSKTKVLNAGVLPTPALAFGVLDRKADLGIMVTASHNPHTDNGIKFFSHDGTKLSHQEEEELETLIDQCSTSCPSKNSPEKVDLLNDYINNLRSFFPANCLSGLKIGLDLANGATCQTTPRIIKELGAAVFSIHQGEGLINDACGSENLDALVELVLGKKLDLGIAHDGDGDRVRFVGPNGKVIDGDQILGLLASYAHRVNPLLNKSFVATAHSNSGLAEFLNKQGIHFHSSDIGDRNVRQLMKQTDTNWGGESSGHIICENYLPTGDGVFAALSILECIRHQSLSLEELAKDVVLWPSQSEAFFVKSKPAFKEVPLLWNTLQREQKLLQNCGRILLRYSGTEPKIRLLVEAKTMDKVSSSFDELRQAIQKSL